jgi:hypothetical protein
MRFALLLLMAAVVKVAAAEEVAVESDGDGGCVQPTVGSACENA